MRATAWLLAAGLVAVGVPASARTIIVGPHDSIQGAVDQGRPWGHDRGSARDVP